MVINGSFPLLSSMWDAADIGAKAYANSAPEHSFSTQEVILSMLQHDERFLSLVREKSHDADIDQLSLELAVADSYRSLVEREGAARTPKLRHFCQPKPVHCQRFVGHASQPSINMIIPSNYATVDQIALEVLYQYWGIMYVRY